MGRRCQICSNTSINIINRALLGGATLSEIARRHGLALGSLHRHRSNCLELPTSRAAVAAPSRLAGIEAVLPTREEVAGGFASIRSQLDAKVDAARAKGQLSISVAALDGLRKTWADTARLAGHDRPADLQVNVNTGRRSTSSSTGCSPWSTTRRPGTSWRQRCSTLMACRHRPGPLHRRSMPSPGLRLRKPTPALRRLPTV